MTSQLSVQVETDIVYSEWWWHIYFRTQVSCHPLSAELIAGVCVVMWDHHWESLISLLGSGEVMPGVSLHPQLGMVAYQCEIALPGQAGVMWMSGDLR